MENLETIIAEAEANVPEIKKTPEWKNLKAQARKLQVAGVVLGTGALLSLSSAAVAASQSPWPGPMPSVINC